MSDPVIYTEPGQFGHLARKEAPFWSLSRPNFDTLSTALVFLKLPVAFAPLPKVIQAKVVEIGRRTCTRKRIGHRRDFVRVLCKHLIVNIRLVRWHGSLTLNAVTLCSRLSSTRPRQDARHALGWVINISDEHAEIPRPTISM